jgi:aminoglycoside phosphotransferase (APT) family kinase protein
MQPSSAANLRWPALWCAKATGLPGQGWWVSRHDYGGAWEGRAARRPILRSTSKKHSTIGATNELSLAMTDTAPIKNPMDEFQTKLAAVMDRIVGDSAPVENLGRLSGGANMESWSFDFAEQGFVLRRAPSAAFMEGRAFGHDVEAALVRAAVAAGVTAPSVVAELRSEDGLGTGYIMRRVEAEVSPAKILASPAPSLLDDIALELARIHAIQPRPDIAIPIMDTAAAVAELKSRFLFYGGDRPIIALALRWCETNMPAVVEPVLVHGDFRMGNLMADANGLAAVLDWELAHWGDAHEDLAYGCMAVWRFGHYHRPAFGLGSLDAYFAAYEKHSGSKVDWERFRFWLVYRTLWWALGCLQMTSIWRSGADRSLERAVIGRRTSENEVDLLLCCWKMMPLKQNVSGLVCR